MNERERTNEIYLPYEMLKKAFEQRLEGSYSKLDQRVKVREGSFLLSVKSEELICENLLYFSDFEMDGGDWKILMDNIYLVKVTSLASIFQRYWIVLWKAQGNYDWSSNLEGHVYECYWNKKV